MISSHLNKIAAVLSVIIGLMAVFAGGKVLLGNLPDYYVISWLPGYNFFIGVVSLFVTSVIIWKKHKAALPLALSTLAIHASVMLILLAAYRSVVAIDSLVAMIVRITVWLIIIALLVLQTRSQKGKPDLTVRQGYP